MEFLYRMVNNGVVSDVLVNLLHLLSTNRAINSKRHEFRSVNTSHEQKRRIT